MNKPYIFLILTIQLFLFSSCTTVKSSDLIKSNSINPYSIKGSNQGLVNSYFYKDGTYIGEGDLKDYGKEIATITINDGKITDVIYQRVDASGKELIRTESCNIKITDLRREILKDDIMSDIGILVNEVIKKQSYDISLPTNNKDMFLNWRLAVKRAMEQAKK